MKMKILILINCWIKFVNRKHWQPTSSALICIKYFEGKFLKKGEHEKRFRLIKTLKPTSTIYPASTKTSSVYQVSLPRKSPKKRVFREDQHDEFKRNNNIIGLESITESDCPHGYLYAKFEDHVVFHKIVLTLIQDGHFRGCSGMGGKKVPLPKIYHTYPTMLKLGSYTLPKEDSKNI